MTLVIEPEEISRRYRAALTYARNVVRCEDIMPMVWLARCEKARGEGDLPLALALIHPRSAPLTEQRWKGLRGARFGFLYRSPYEHCMATQVWGYSCPLTEEALELDHAWPYALGGRSTSDNAVWLCKCHNRAKSSDVHCYHWSAGALPEWLGDLLRRMERDVRSGRYSKSS